MNYWSYCAIFSGMFLTTIVLTHILPFYPTLSYVKPLYPKRPLSEQENHDLQKNCGRPPNIPVSVNQTEAPWAVAFVSTEKWKPYMKVDEMYKHFGAVCSATLISPRHVLTAAHCIKLNILRAYFVIVMLCKQSDGLECNAKPKYLRTASRVFSSVRFDELNRNKSENNGGDMAVFELTDDIPFSQNVWPVCLGDKPIKIGSNLDLYGFETRGSNENQSWALQHAPLVTAKCENQTLDLFCSSGAYQKPCGDQSGAGLIHTDRHDRNVLVGTHATGFSCDKTKEPTVIESETPIAEHTMLSPHLCWICKATGICVIEKIKENVEITTNLTNSHRERYEILEPLDEDKIYV